MNKRVFKFKHYFVLLSITSVLSLSSCLTTLLLASLNDENNKPEQEKVVDDASVIFVPKQQISRLYGYDFSSKNSEGKTLCYRIVDDNNKKVWCVTPGPFYDPKNSNVVAYQLSGDVVIPKTVNVGKTTYTVSGLGMTNNDDRTYFGERKNITNLVIPETVETVEGFNPGKELQNVVCYSRSRDVTNELLSSRSWQTRSGNGGWYVVHVPIEFLEEVNKFNYGLIDYDIYTNGNTVRGYLNEAKDKEGNKIKQQIISKACTKCEYDFAVESKNTQGVFLYFRVTDEINNKVTLAHATIADGVFEVPLIIPKTVAFNNKTYTVTAIEPNFYKDGYGQANLFVVVVVPETIHHIPKIHVDGSSYPEEIIFYSPDVTLEGKYDVLHVPQGTVEKYRENAYEAIVEIVDNYSIYDNLHTYDGYMVMAKGVVEREKAAEAERKKQADIKRQQEEQAAQEAELKKIKGELSKKYGAKYVNALFEGKIIVGMPMDLFYVGLKGGVFKSPHWITNVELDYESGKTSAYRLYGYKNSSTALDVVTSSPSFIGKVWFENDKVSSISWW